MSLDTNSVYTSAGIKAASSQAAQDVYQLDKLQKQWDTIVGRDIADIKKEPFIADARKVNIEVGAGNATSLKSMNRIPTATSPLEEGLTPTGQGYTLDAFSISVAEYGSFIGGTNQTDVVTSMGSISVEAMKALKLSAVESKAKIVRDTVVAQASEYFAGGKTSKLALVKGDLPKIIDMFSIRRTIRKNRGKTFGGSVKVVADFEVEDTLLLYDEIIAAFMNFGNTNALLKDANVTNMMGLKFVFLEYGYESDITMVEHSSSDARITPIVIYAKDSFVIAEQKGGLGIQMIFKPVGSSGTQDPLNQRWTFGWYIGNFGVKVKNPRHVFAYWVTLDPADDESIAAVNVNVANIADTPTA